MSRLSYARVLVELDLLGNLLYSINIILPNGATLVQSVVYETLSKFCKHCKILGHTTNNCSKAPKAKEPSTKGDKDIIKHGSVDDSLQAFYGKNLCGMEKGKVCFRSNIWTRCKLRLMSWLKVVKLSGEGERVISIIDLTVGAYLKVMMLIRELVLKRV
jgi:hypothetical protein